MNEEFEIECRIKIRSGIKDGWRRHDRRSRNSHNHGKRKWDWRQLRTRHEKVVW